MLSFCYKEVVVCHNPDKKYLKELLDDVKQTCHLLSSEMKPERERMVCRAFLRCAGIPFTEEEIIASKVEPPDVLFDSARFEVRELMDEDRLRHSDSPPYTFFLLNSNMELNRDC
jgi:Putative endonuclease, protein of unknown function (DUF1780)